MLGEAWETWGGEALSQARSILEPTGSPPRETDTTFLWSIFTRGIGSGHRVQVS